MLQVAKSASPSLLPVSRARTAEQAQAAPASPSRRLLLATATLLAASPLALVRSSWAQGEPASVTLLHAVLNVADLEASASFFVAAYGMTRTRTRPGNAFVAFGSESRGEHFALELSPVAQTPPSLGALHSLVLSTDNPSAAVARAVRAGAKRDSQGSRCSGDAFSGCGVVGPDGVRVRFVKASAKAPRLARLVLQVPNLGEATAFFTDVLGLAVVKRQPGVTELAFEDQPVKTARVLLGSSKADGTLIELREAVMPPSAVDSLIFDKLAVAVPSDALPGRVAAARGCKGAEVVKDTFEVPGVGTHVALLADGGITVALVDAADFERELV
jgi:catechol 2,3-dioxygenase-like lactoylglutathione lyase family enzyme